MVRVDTEQPVLNLQQRDSIVDESSAKKQKTEPSSIWPCRINGCNKQFAREADLKRHQRTAKSHTQSDSQLVVCPQCDSTFTRTDALRRHQRSRHNGVIIDPIDLSNGRRVDDNNGEGSSTSVSRSNSPARIKRKRAMSPPNITTTAPVQTIVTRPDTSGPASGAQSYYRHHTFNPVFVPPRTPNGVIESSHYPASTQAPASAAKTHAWLPNPPWIQENPGVPNSSTPVTFVQPTQGYYTTSPYYRAPDGQPAIVQALPPGVVTMQVKPSTSNSRPSKDPAPTEDSGKLEHVKPPDDNPNFDPLLENTSLNEAKPQLKPLAENFDDTGLSAAVKKALQVVLSIDPTLHSTVAAVHEMKHDMAQTGLSSTRSASVTNKQSDRCISGALDGKDAGVDIDVNREVDSPIDFTFHGQADTPESPSSMIPDGIKDLINEDPSSYAITT